MYSIRNVLTQSPDKVKNTILAVAGVGIALLTDADPSLLETVGAGIAIERVLDLLYAAPVKKANDEARTLEGIDLGRQLGPQA